MDINDLNDEQPIEAAAAKRKVGRPKGSTNGSGKKNKSTKKTKSAKKASAKAQEVNVSATTLVHCVSRSVILQRRLV